MSEPSRWLVLTHHLPPDPPYLRVKVRRRLERLGAVALKNSVYVLPCSDEALEDFSWLRQEIERDGGEATVAEASFVDGVTDSRLVEQFRAAREQDYAGIEEAAADVTAELRRAGAPTPALEAKVKRLTTRLEEVRAMDYFKTPARKSAELAVRGAQLMQSGEAMPSEDATAEPDRVTAGRSWVTRAGVKVDRMASAWLIRRFIDPGARFRFVSERDHEAERGELRFDMYDGEYTHVGEACTFETLLGRFALSDPALRALSEIVHDIDCKDERFARAEAPGLALVVDGIARAHTDDAARIERATALFDDLYAHFERMR